MSLDITEVNLSRWLGDQSFERAKAKYDREGYIIFENVMPHEDVEAVRKALEPHFTKTGRNYFEGFKSNRVYSLLTKAPDIFAPMVMHPLAMAFVEADLGRSCLLSSLLAINLHPGETVQDWHHDDQHADMPLPRPAFGTSTFWAIDDTTEENGATEILPGSHLWKDDQGLGHPPIHDTSRGKDQSNLVDPQPRTDAIKATMPAGSLMITKGTLWHRGGANRSDRRRLIVTPQYCSGWVRQLENILLATPKEVAAALPKRVRELVGYSIHGAFMGYVDGAHPEKTLNT